MIEMHPCPACTELVTDGTCVCPHCGEKACRRSGVRGAALLLGLSLVAGCGASAQSDYAAPVTGATTTPPDTGDTGTAASSTEAAADEEEGE